MLKKEPSPQESPAVTLDSGFQKLRQRIAELESSISRRKEREDKAPARFRRAFPGLRRPHLRLGVLDSP